VIRGKWQSPTNIRNLYDWIEMRWWLLLYYTQYNLYYNLNDYESNVQKYEKWKNEGRDLWCILPAGPPNWSSYIITISVLIQNYRNMRCIQMHRTKRKGLPYYFIINHVTRNNTITTAERQSQIIDSDVSLTCLWTNNAYRPKSLIEAGTLGLQQDICGDYKTPSR